MDTTEAPLGPAEEAAVSELLIVTGMSGAGRSTTANTLEDQGWFVIENLPPVLMGTLTDLLAKPSVSTTRLAIVVDVRGPEVFRGVRETLRTLESAGISHRVLFLDADDASLVERFTKEQRPHPLQGHGNVLDAITAERAELADVRKGADIVLDTTGLNVHQLSTLITRTFSESGRIVLQVSVMSFGFKYGLPADADHVADVRFIPNPHWVPALRALTGLDEAVSDYVLGADGVSIFLDRYLDTLAPVLAGYRRENKHFVTIALGCTGGKHRSVALTIALAQRLSTLPDITVTTHHRDLGRE